MAGGIGMRLWPTSRQHKPKQFQDVLGVGETLLQMTYRRYSKFISPENIIIVTNENYMHLVNEQLPEVPDSNIYLEHVRRNTLPSATFAALNICRRNPHATMVLAPCDQYIIDEDSFKDDVLKGLAYAERSNRVLSLGVVPDRPSSEYGYVQMGDDTDTQQIYRVQSFTEKPQREFATMFMESGEFLWNTGIFVSGARTFLDQIHGVSPEFTGLIDNVKVLYATGQITDDIITDTFSKCPNITLEAGLLERSGKLDVLLCHFDWQDLGSWNSIFAVREKQNTPAQNRNNSFDNVVIDSKSLLYDCSECLVKLPSGHVAVIQGLHDYVVVEEDNVLVVCRKHDQKAIRKFVNDAQLGLGEEFV